MCGGPALDRKGWAHLPGEAAINRQRQGAIDLAPPHICAAAVLVTGPQRLRECGLASARVKDEEVQHVFGLHAWLQVGR